MSLQFYTKPVAFSGLSGLVGGIASTLIATPPRASLYRTPSLCSRCYAQQFQRQSRQRLSTVTEYRPHSLNPAPPPPRNTNIPDTSIAGASPAVINSRPPRLAGQYETASIPGPREKQTVSVTEAEAQKSKPVLDPTSSTASNTKPKRSSKLRPRKAAITLTPGATAQLRNLLCQPDPKLIRVGVKNRGCSGLAYHLEYVEKQGAFDEAVEQDGVKVLVDSKALFSIIGSEMDWVEDKLNQRFVFRNPNIKEQCGCGESFMV